MSSLDYLDLCRLCLVKDRVSVPIFEGEGDVRQMFLKITACLPVKVAREDKLPKKICDDCVYKVELFYQFWNSTANAEKQLLQWLGEVGLEGKQGYVTGVLNPSTMKQEDGSSAAGLGGGATMQVSGAQPGIGIGVIDNISLGMPLIITGATQQQLTTTVPMNTSSVPIQPVHQAVPGPSNQTGHEQLSQSQANSSTRHQDDEEDTSEEEENSDDDCDGDDGLPVKEESEEDPSNSRTIEPTTFVNVSLACDEAGPSGLQQQKITEIPEMSMPQNVDGDPKSGFHFFTGFDANGNGDSQNPASRTAESLLRTARRIRSAGPFKCPICNCGFRSFPPLKQHISRLHAVALPQALQCHHCNFETQWKGNLHGHMRLHASEFPGGNKKRPCNLCDRTFSNIKNLLNHRNVHKPTHISSDSWEPPMFECDFCGLRLERKGHFSRHRRLHVMRLRLACIVCHKWFRYRDKLELHNKSMHLKDRPFSCLFCEKSYKTKSILQKHTKTHGKQQVCYICGAVRESQESLEEHLSNHDKEYNVFCMTCNKGFHSVKKLDAHTVQDHIGEEPFKCLICGNSFASRTYLKLHTKNHETPARYKCSICSFVSSWKNSLRVHMKIHSGENLMTCEVCGKCLSTKTSFETHMRIHTGEKPHVCEVCGKAFSARKYLYIHNRIHTGEKPYACEVCPKRFSQKGSMKLHMKSQHVPSST